MNDWFPHFREGLPRPANDRALAAGSRRAKTPQAVECEASQSGAESATPNPSNPIPPIQCEER